MMGKPSGINCIYAHLRIKGMYNDREDMSLSFPRYLEKAIDISCTMHCLLVSSLAISEN
jgi:hypothetical protein